MKIGIYGGTFNPPHLGHLTAAAAVIATLKLDKLLLIPASIPPHKDLPAGSATAEQRLEMTRMAGEHLGLGSKVETLDMEVRRAGKSFTSDTLAELKAQFPEDELWLLMGTDMFLSFETWHEPEKIASLAGIAAFGRTKADMEPQFSAQRDKLYRLYPDARIFTLTVPGVIDISSTELRERLASGTGENLLPPAVYGYILRNHLYGTDVNLKSLTLSQLRPVALSYLKYKRIPHVLGTEQEAIRLATRYGADVEKARVAALLHDCTKKLDMPEQLALCRQYGIELDELEQKALKLLHAKTGAAIAREIADVTIRADSLEELVTLKAIANALQKRVGSNYRFVLSFNSALILLGALGILPPATSAMLHNLSTLGISLRSMTDLLEQKPSL